VNGLLESNGEQVYTSYGVWTSLGHVALYDAAAHGPRWLGYARNNLIEGGERRHAHPTAASARWSSNAVGVLPQYCPPGQTGWNIDHIRDDAEAWVQQLQVALVPRAEDSRTDAAALESAG
jgi:hypothetical protein